jgi:formylglycine-generating enzyme required for sulfatase activity/tRNA A-37 threonylcarbamoyl transferase component Bud32
VEDYLARFPALADERSQLVELLAAEFTHRQRNEPEISPDALAQRFRNLAADLRRRCDRLAGHRFAASAETPSAVADASTDQLPATLSFTPPENGSRDDAPTDGSQNPRNRTFGDYELLETIASGGMGVVYKARQTKLNRIVALKMIKAGELADAEDVKRFYSEAEAAAKLDHPGIVPVYEVGQENGQHFYSMAFVAGKSLNDQVKQDGPVAPRTAAELMKTVAEAVEYAHKKGIVHRDIKPQNVLLDENEQPRVTDFGLAKQVQGASELTVTGQVMGTPSYMPPEQAVGAVQDIGPASDVYALGATLYFLLIGRPPFQTASPAETLLQVIEADPVPLRRLNPAIPRDLETICLKCLRKELSKRYGAAAELADDLGRWLSGKPIQARRVSSGERAWLWCKRRPAIAGLAAALVILATAGTWISVERQNAVHAAGLVDSLVKADVGKLPDVFAQLDSYDRRTRPALEALAAVTPSTSDERRTQLHARLALVRHDEQHLSPLVEELLSGNLAYLGIVRERLSPYKSRLEPEMWKLLHDVAVARARRFRAGLALAVYATDSPQWGVDDYAFLAEQLIASNAEQQPRLRDYLRPLSGKLLDDLGRLFADAATSDALRLNTANALADFVPDDAVRLAKLLPLATPEQFAVLYPLVAVTRDSAARRSLIEIVDEQPTIELKQAERLTLGQRRAGAAIALLRLGERDAALTTLRVDDDPESLTQFVHRLRARGVSPAELLDCINDIISREDAKTRREHVDVLRAFAASREAVVQHSSSLDARVLFGLLLAIGEFELADLPDDRREGFLAQLGDWYAHDPSSAVHGASGWLLRHWGQDEMAKKVDETPVAYSPDREWFTLKIEPHKPDAPARQPVAGDTHQPEAQARNEQTAASGPSSLALRVGVPDPAPIYITFVVFPAGEYVIGSPDGEAVRQVDEARHRVTLTRPFAVSDREITWEQFNPFDNGGHHDTWVKKFGRTLTPQDPAWGVNWYEAVAYCRWLTEQAGMNEDEQAYADPKSSDAKTYPADLAPHAGGAPRNWPLNLEKHGFRLPTEAEWEAACRCGVETPYSFGGDEPLLAQYGWYANNSAKWSHVVAQLRPNARGLFDMHGNLFEWCHDWYGNYADHAADPVGAATGAIRVNRGGGWGNDAAFCRAAVRGGIQPTIRDNLGFRLALGSVQESKPREQASSERGRDEP